MEDVVQLLLIEELEDIEVRNRRVHRRRLDPFNELSDEYFIKVFRLSKALAQFLVHLLKDYIAPANRSTDLDITTKVLVTLRFLASGSYQMDVGSNYYFGISQPSVSRCIEEVVNAMNRNEIFNAYVHFPRNIQELNAARMGFFEKYNFPGIIGCIDCTHVAIFPPKVDDDNYPEHIYVNRKNYHSINVQLICDHNLKIINVNALFPGSTNDAFIWNQSNVQTLLRRLHEAGNKNYFLLGDSGYPLRSWLLTPLEYEPRPNIPEHFYNSRHKTIRSTIERCNGVLKMRFRCLLKHRVLHYSPEKASKIINACVLLHNLCIEHNIETPQNEEAEQIDLGVHVPERNHVVERVNPELAAGRNQRNKLITLLQQ
ncbi:putative nuclease HARBI1 [Photinus pyralis]|uniref:putative nuclease HARBI1 n=1 Tax=Photinus pyralis TaxID=7054 RepID=UPI0012672D32|nr:putative nuclease HARBI1 [Photinus pyralis]